MNLFFKILGYLFALLFTISAVLQYNDTDALRWIIIYGIAALISLAFALNKIGYVLPLVLGVLAFIAFLYLYPSDFQGFDLNDGDIATVELGREAFGLLIISIVMLVFSFRIKRKL
ncbi:transmembrane 220 family protein [uncultured Maribacter sp.]|uniref:transmembrane 220 family protein n=1 Tax=uncultured Maribacter sp. TaxID=431308 RepID=UPI0030ED5C08